MGFQSTTPLAFATHAATRTALRTAAVPLALAPLSEISHSMHHLWDTTMHLSDAVAATMPAAPPDGLHVMDSVREEMALVKDEVALFREHQQEVHELIPPELAEESLGNLGHDILLFLFFSVLVDPLSNFLGVSAVLLYLVLGFVVGPYGFNFFLSGTVDTEIGDFGILFLLFVEGLNLSPERLKALGGFFSLGLAQLLLSVGGIFFLFFWGGPYLLPIVQDVRVPIDPATLQLLEKPVIAFSIAAAGALSSSAFVLPILKEKGWEQRADGIAALSILLLQDLAVAPLLVALPLIAEYDRNGGSIQDPNAVALLAAKATIGFGSILVLASVILRRVFQVVASYGSSQTFVAASLLVAVGMGIVAEDLGLSSTTGAFAAGVLLAESGYRAQIEADIKPFEGILLGVFFITAGAALDPVVCIEQWPTLLAGIGVFIGIKLAIIFAAGEFALGLTRADSARVALLLAGGGEFSFVVFKLATDVGVLPGELCKLLTASVVISMSLTPVLGEIAEVVGNKLEAMNEGVNGVNNKRKSYDVEYDVFLTDEDMIREAFETFDDDGNGAICASELKQVLTKPGTNAPLSDEEVRAVIAMYDDNDDGELEFDEFAKLWTSKRRAVIGIDEDEEKDKSNEVPESLSNAVVVCGYGQVGQALCSAMDQANKNGIGGGVPYVALSREPSRISAGVVNGASVVYGDGASPSLIRTMGVKNPSALAVVYKSESRCLDTTMRLREAFPTVPIYVRADRRESVEHLMAAGATEVIIETEKVAEAFRTLVSRYGDTSISLMREALWTPGVDEGKEETLPFTELELGDLAFECDKTPEELTELYELYSTSLNKNEKGEVCLSELRNELMRRRNQPMDDKTLAEWMGYEESLSKWTKDGADTNWVTFADFVRFSVRKLEPDD